MSLAAKARENPKLEFSEGIIFCVKNCERNCLIKGASQNPHFPLEPQSQIEWVVFKKVKERVSKEDKISTFPRVINFCVKKWA